MTVDPGFLLAVAEGAPDPEYIRNLAAVGFKVTIDDLTGTRRTVPLVDYRHVAMAAVRDLTGASYPAIGRLFGGRDHTSVMSACRKVRHDPRMMRMVKALKAEVVRQWATDYGIPLEDIRPEIREPLRRQVVFS